jgi:hypothetical protein
MNTQEMIAVMQAYVDGKTIECQCTSGGDWKLNPTPAWDWAEFLYRVKPEPKVFYIVVRDDGCSMGAFRELSPAREHCHNCTNRDERQFGVSYSVIKFVEAV